MARQHREIPREPSTAQEWQQAVDGAAFVLLLDSARQYGIIEGGPALKAERCADILSRGEALGYRPASFDELIGRFVH